MSNPPDSISDPVSAPSSPPSRKIGFWHVLTGVGIIVLLISLFLPDQRGVRETSRRLQCANHLKQIVLAIHGYESNHKALPPAYTVDALGKPLHSWRTLILPYLDQSELYNSINLAKPWNDPANVEAYNTRMRAFQCPSSGLPSNFTTYLAVVGKNCCLDPTRPRPVSEITADLTETLMVIDAAPEQGVHWMSPLDAYEQLILDFGKGSKQQHRFGANACMAAGNVLLLPDSMTERERRALLSINAKDK